MNIPNLAVQLAVLLIYLLCNCIDCNVSRQDMQNKHRIKKSPDNKNMIKWDDELEQEAQAYVDKCDYNPKYKFKPNRGFNTAVYPGKRKITMTIEDWNIDDYASADKIGCAAKWCEGNMKGVKDWNPRSGTLYICIYSPLHGGQSQSQTNGNGGGGQTPKKPVWATRRYQERKTRDFKKYEAEKTQQALLKELQKPKSADPSKRRKSVMGSKSKDGRAQSVPARKLSMGVNEDDSYYDGEETYPADETVPPTFDPDIRPMTSILRVRSGKRNTDDESRPKTTHPGGPRRRVTLVDAGRSSPPASPPSHRRSHTSGDAGEENVSLALTGYTDVIESRQTTDKEGPKSGLTQAANDVLVLRSKKPHRRDTLHIEDATDDTSTMSATPRSILSDFTTPRISQTNNDAAARTASDAHLDLNIAPVEKPERMPNLVKKGETLRRPGSRGKSSSASKNGRRNSSKDTSEHGEVVFFPAV